MFGADRYGAANSGRLFFDTYNAGIRTTKMVVLPSGEIGIDTSAPTHKLDVNGSSIIRSTLTVTSTATLAAASVTGAFTLPALAADGYPLHITTNGVVYSAPASAGAVTLTATQTFTGANTFASTATFTQGKINVSTYAAFIPYYVIPPTTWAAASTQTWTVNMTTGVYEINIAGSATAEMDYRWDSDSASGGYFGGYLISNHNSQTAPWGYTNGNAGYLIPAEINGLAFTHRIVIGGPANTTLTSYDGTTNLSTNHYTGGTQWIRSGYPTTLTIFTAGTFTGRISMRKVSE